MIHSSYAFFQCSHTGAKKAKPTFIILLSPPPPNPLYILNIISGSKYRPLSIQKPLDLNMEHLIMAIENHIPGRLSELEEEMAIHIPPGGNWESIPIHIPSNRLVQIRKMSKERGKCRTTYYGRLNPSKPSYTINTYFSRLGNGTFLHYDMEQNRLISQREGARLQSFPDSYIFKGSYTSIFKQIGNAIPPFLAYNLVTNQFKESKVLDLFCGAGGLSLGLSWGGMEIVCGVDNDKNAIKTFKHNHNDSIVISGDLKDNSVKEQIFDIASDVDFVVGGPPCQGFSQAGWFNPDDRRNFLFLDFLDIISRISPKYFIMENVQGLLWIDKGKAIQTIISAFKDIGYYITDFVLSAEEYGVPQKRKRVFILGMKENNTLKKPDILCKDASLDLHPEVTAMDAISDLPPISDRNTTFYDYIYDPSNRYQELMRGNINAEQYYLFLKQGGMSWEKR